MNQYQTYSQVNFSNDISKHQPRNSPPNKNEQKHDDSIDKPKTYNWLRMLYHKLAGKKHIPAASQ